ncbi:hypothetical protein [uncultured Olegusella sp.]|uniref:hypothetical protein n=1 Tax=uncultured Olegusella sp. TaxID=1979846 RepID=UPI00262CB4B2|nr:hypothetical protein [uncultured Olegusella sp.]
MQINIAHLLRSARTAAVISAGIACALSSTPAVAMAEQANTEPPVHKAAAAPVTYGCDFTDNIQMNGHIYVAGDWTATVQYRSALVDDTTQTAHEGGQTPGASGQESEIGSDSDFALEGYQVYDSQTKSWSAAKDKGRANEGKVDVLYSTKDGVWVDGASVDGDDKPDGGGVEHANGTYLLTIPTAIKYSGMRVGTVDTSDDYIINVQGALPAGKAVKVWAETGKILQGPRDGGSEIKETTSMKSPNGVGEYTLAAGEYAAILKGDEAPESSYRIVSAREAWNENKDAEAGQSAKVAREFKDIVTQ